MRNTTTTAALAGLLLAAAPGCDDTSSDPGNTAGSHKSPRELSSQGAALTATENTENALRGFVESADFLADSAAAAEAFESMGDEPPCACPPNVDCAEFCGPENDGQEQLAEMRDDMHQVVDELVQTLRDEIFTQDNLDPTATTETSVTYRLDAGDLCPEEPQSGPASPLSDVPAAAPEPAQDPECVEQVGRLDLRLRIESFAEGDVDITVVTTDQNLEPATFELHQGALGLQVDLDDTLNTIRAVGGGDLDVITHLAGVVQLQLVNNGAQDFSVLLNILEDLELGISDAGQELKLALAKTAPAFELNANGGTKTLSAAFDLGQFNGSAPLSLLQDSEEQPAAEGLLDLLVAGASATLSYTADSDVFDFKNLGLGNAPSRVQLDGEEIITVDVNPENGRRFNVQVKESEGGAMLTFNPGIDLRIGWALQTLASQLEDVPEELFDDAWRFWFEGEEPTLAVSDQMQVESGALHMTTEANPEEDLHVEAGMCLEDGSSNGDQLTSPVAIPVTGDLPQPPPPDYDPAAEAGKKPLPPPVEVEVPDGQDFEEVEEGGLFGGMQIAECR